jgi:membrane protein implicated in regulation of membrane protease activity
MKLSDIITIHSFFSKLTPQLNTWLLTFFFISTIVLAFLGSRQWYNNYLDKQEMSRQRDGIIIGNQFVIISKINKVDKRIDSISMRQRLQNKKLETVGDHIQRIENGNNSILYEFQRLDDFYNMFNDVSGPEKKYMADTINTQIKWRKKP